MRTLQPSLAALLLASVNVHAGCIGPVVLGECHGREVPWETGDHGTDVREPGPAAALPPPKQPAAGGTPFPGTPGPAAKRRSSAPPRILNPRDIESQDRQAQPGRFR
jgi:hypothetical protein